MKNAVWVQPKPCAHPPLEPRFLLPFISNLVICVLPTRDGARCWLIPIYYLAGRHRASAKVAPSAAATESALELLPELFTFTLSCPWLQTLRAEQLLSWISLVAIVKELLTSSVVARSHTQFRADAVLIRAMDRNFDFIYQSIDLGTKHFFLYNSVQKC